MLSRPCAFLVLFLVGCGAPAVDPGPAKSRGTEAELVRHATIELDCAEEHLDLERLTTSSDSASASYRVSGCGWIAEYAHQDGKWVMTEGDAVSRNPPVDEPEPGQVDPHE